MSVYVSVLYFPVDRYFSPCMLQWDFSGDLKFRQHVLKFVKASHLAVIVFDATKQVRLNKLSSQFQMHDAKPYITAGGTS